MGFFKKLFSGGTIKSDLSPFQQQLEKAMAQSSDDSVLFWDWRNAKARDIANQILVQAAPDFGNAKIKENPDEETIELRGTWDEAPFRVGIRLRRGGVFRPEMMCKSQIGEFDIERDHTKIPKEKDESDPWDKDESRRIFLGKGIFVEGSDNVIEENLATWSKLTKTLQTQILTEMERLDLRWVTTSSDGISVGTRKLNDIEHPVELMNDCARLLADIKNATDSGGGQASVQDTNSTVSATGPSLKQVTVSCSFCSSLFIITPDHNTCPNCGAPAEK